MRKECKIKASLKQILNTRAFIRLMQGMNNNSFKYYKLTLRFYEWLNLVASNSYLLVLVSKGESVWTEVAVISLLFPDTG